MVNGDTLYTLIAFIPKQYIDKRDHEKFFSGFRISREVTPNIYSSKAGALMDALKTKDSAQFAQMMESFQAVKFAKEDLTFLHKALLETYFDSTGDYGIHEKIVSTVSDLADASTIDFITANYKILPAGKESLRYSLLQVLANIHTKESYDQLKQLLMSKLPSKGSSASLEFALTDSLELTKTLYPEILSLSKDSAFAEGLVTVTDRLLDSSLISINDVLPYKNIFLEQARVNYQLFKTDQGQWWQYNNWISFLGKFNDKETNALLQEYSNLSSLNLKYNALIALIRNGQQVSSTEMQKMAADKDFRASLYYELKKMNRQHLFPAAYAKQQSLAESELHQIASDEYEVDATSFIGERIIFYKDKKKKFYLYKITLNFEEGEQESYLGVAGPYDPNQKELISYTDASGIYWEEAFNKQKVEEHLKNFISQIEAGEE
jgi:HEAT repeat protein